MNKFSKVLFILGFSVSLIFGLVYLHHFSSHDTFISHEEIGVSRTDWINIQSIVAKISDLWSYPDRLSHIDWQKAECPYWNFQNNHKVVDLRQNFLVFSCILNNKIRHADLKQSVFVNEFREGNEQYYLKKLDSEFNFFNLIKKDKIPLNDYLPFEGLILTLGKVGQSEWSFSFTLSFDQKIKYLPQGSYFYGQDLNQLPYNLRKRSSQNNQNFAKVRSWDNIGRFFFVDKMPVKNMDLIGSNILKEKKNTVNVELLHNEKAVHYLSAEEQTSFCKSRGMQLLDAATYDAATFYKNIRNYQQESSRSLYYFGDRWPMKNRCQLQKTKECKSNSVTSHEELQISWMGLMSFVDEFESLRNDFDPFFNLHPGSKYFSEKSAWQFLGHRLHWSGNNFYKDDFQWVSSIMGVTLEIYSSENYLPIQFRCMKEWVTYP